MTLYLAATLAPIFDKVYSHLPGGSFFGFLGSLPDSAKVTAILLSLPGSSTVLHELGALGVLG